MQLNKQELAAVLVGLRMLKRSRERMNDSAAVSQIDDLCERLSCEAAKVDPCREFVQVVAECESTVSGPGYDQRAKLKWLANQAREILNYTDGGNDNGKA